MAEDYKNLVKDINVRFNREKFNFEKENFYKEKVN
jgi:hypothetical protein